MLCPVYFLYSLPSINDQTKCGDTGPGAGPEFCFHLSSNLNFAVSTLQTRLGHGQTTSVARDRFLLLILCLT